MGVPDRCLVYSGEYLMPVSTKKLDDLLTTTCRCAIIMVACLLSLAIAPAVLLKEVASCIIWYTMELAEEVHDLYVQGREDGKDQ